MNQKNLTEDIVSEAKATLELLHELEPGTAKYDQTLNHFERLMGQLKSQKRWYNDSEIIKTILSIGGNFALAILVLYFEKTDSIVSKAWGLIGRRMI